LPSPPEGEWVAPKDFFEIYLDEALKDVVLEAAQEYEPQQVDQFHTFVDDHLAQLVVPEIAETLLDAWQLKESFHIGWEQAADHETWLVALGYEEHPGDAENLGEPESGYSTQPDEAGPPVPIPQST